MSMLAFRELSHDEISNVSGGDDGEVIVVTATRAQVDAAMTAYARAQNDVSLFSIAVTFFFGTIPGAGGMMGGVEAVTQDLTWDQIQDILVEGRAEYLYQQDRLDGVYDGYGPQDYAPIAQHDAYM